MNNPTAQSVNCSVAGCEKPVIARGLCSTHYRRVRRQETGEGVAELNDPLERRREGSDSVFVTGPRVNRVIYAALEHKAALEDVSLYELQVRLLEKWVKESVEGTTLGRKFRVAVTEAAETSAHKQGDEDYRLHRVRVSTNVSKALKRAARTLSSALLLSDGSVSSISVYAVVRAVYSLATS